MSPQTTVVPKPGRQSPAPHRWQTQVWIGAALVFLIPVVGQLTARDFQWGPGDFVIAAVMLTVFCGLYEIAVMVSANVQYRMAAALALLSSFALVFINLAVGVIGNEDHPANMMYHGVVLAGFLAALFVRFDPRYMARVMTGMAIVQLVVAGIGATIAWNTGDSDPNRPLGTFVLSTVFALCWLLAAALFRKAATPA